MLPHNHFIISSTATAPAAYFMSPTGDAHEMLLWMLVAGLVSVVVDTDVLAIVMLRAGRHNALREFLNPLNIFRRFERFMEGLYQTGLLRVAMLTHLIMSACIMAAFYLYAREWAAPAILGVLTHIASDIPNIRKALS